MIDTNNKKETPNTNTYNGWTISQGDYIRKEDDDSQLNQKILKRIQIIKRIAVIVGISAALILFLIILNFAANF